VSALVIDFGSHTTRAGYAGEDCPRVVCPSFYGYTEEEASSSNGATTNGASGEAAAGSNGDAMDVDGPAEPANGSKKTRKYYVGDDAVGVWRPDMEVDNFMLDGVGKLPSKWPRKLVLTTVHDFEPASHLLHHILHKRLSVDPSEHPLMITEPAWNTPQSREKLAELTFEGEGVPALYFGSSGVLSAYVNGLTHGLY